MEHYGQVDASSTIRIFFTSHAGSGSSLAPLSAYEAGDVLLYKDGSATQRTSTAGWTMTSPFDSIVGLHLLAIDLSDNTDAGFYAAGSRYTAVLSADTETVDGLTVVRVIADFTIGPVAANTTQFAGTAITSAAGIPEVKVNNIAANAITAASIASDAITDAKVAADVTIASVTGAVGSVTGAVGSVTGAVGSVAAGGIAAASFAANAITAAKLDPDVTTELQSGLATSAALTSVASDIATILLAVDTEIAAIKAVTDLFTAAQTEPTGVPAANATPMAKIAWLGLLARNKITQTATTQTVFADDTTTPVATAAVSDNGTTATRAEFA